jgi:energy-coupling factor transporter ATP-binding protein EcfA2
MTGHAGASARGPTEEQLQKLRAFERFTMAHPRLIEVKDRLMSAIHGAAPGSLVLVIGPTGVGKTTLRLKSEQVLTAEMMVTLRDDPGRLPFVSVEAIASLTGSFNWRDHFTRSLLGMNDPLTADKLNGQRLEEEARSIKGRFTPGPRAAGFELQYAVEQALRHRRPAAVFVDEAQHLGRIASGRKLSDQLDVIKSIANRTQTVHVLFGTYELLAFRNLSGQLSRRCLDVHFARYSADSEDDLETFKNVLVTFQTQLPIPACDLVQAWDLLYERSLGCVGIVKEWLLRAVTMALADSKATLTRTHLKESALSASQCEKILAETMEGEMRLSETEGACSRLRLLLGLDTKSVDESPQRQEEASVPIKRRRRAGQRSPKRDQVGVKVAACG